MSEFLKEKRAEALDDYPVVVCFPVAWGDMDAFAHLNNTVYFRYFESGRIAYFREMDIIGSGAPSGVAPILATASCRFKAPITYPDTVQVGITVGDIKTDRYTMHFAVYSEALGCIAATGDGVVVSYDYSAGKKADLPEHWRERIAAIEGSQGES